MMMFMGAGVCLGQDKNIRISVDVLNNRTNDKNNDWLSVGLVDDIIRNLSRIKGLKLVETKQLKEAGSDPFINFSGLIDENTAVKNGKMSGVRYLILGSFRIDGQVLAVNYRMIDVETEKVLFDDEVKGASSSVLEIEEKAGKGIMSTLNTLIPALRVDKKLFNRAYSESAHYNYTMGLTCAVKSDLAAGMECFQKVISEVPDSGDAYLGQGDIYLRNGNTLMALEKLNKALSIYFDKGDEYFINWTYYKIAEAYFLKGDYDNASKSYLKALDYKVYGDSRLSSVYSRLSEIARKKAEPGNAVKYAKEAVKESKLRADKYMEVSTLADLAGLYRDLGKLAQAKEMFSEAFKIAREINYPDIDALYKLSIEQH